MFQSLRCTPGSCLLVSYLITSWPLLVQPGDAAAAELQQELDSQVPRSVFQWQAAGFAAVLVLNVVNLVPCANAVQFDCNLLLAQIHAVAFVTPPRPPRRPPRPRPPPPRARPAGAAAMQDRFPEAPVRGTSPRQ